MAIFRLSPSNNPPWSMPDPLPPAYNDNGEFSEWLANQVQDALLQQAPVFEVAVFQKPAFMEFLLETNCDAVLFYLTYNQGSAKTTVLAVPITQGPAEYLANNPNPILQSTIVVEAFCPLSMGEVNLVLTPWPTNHTWYPNQVPSTGTVAQWISPLVNKNFAFHSVKFTRDEIISVLLQSGCERIGLASVVMKRKVTGSVSYPSGILDANTLALVALNEQNHFLLGTDNELLISADSCRPGPPWSDVLAPNT